MAETLLKLLTFLAFASIAAASWPKLLGSQKCTWGPSYWCSGLKNSAKCGATSHCIATWEANPYPADDDDVCKICKDMVRQARDQLQSNETQTELKEVFEGSCALIPIKIVATECKNLVDEFVPELVETLSSEMNPDTVCSVAGLCNSARIDKLLAKIPRVSRPSDCQICRKESKKLSTRIMNADKDLVVDKLLELCGYLSSYSDACRATVLENFAEIYSILTGLDQGLCDLSGMCPGQSYELAKVGEADIQCEFCEKVIKHWIDTWSSNTTEAEFKQVLEALCHKMKPERVQHCLHIVDDYYIPWFNYLLHELDPETACTVMGLCPAAHDLFAANPKTPLTLLFPPKKIEPETTTTQDLIGGYFVPQTVMAMEQPSCVLCEYVLSVIKQSIGQNKTEEEIREKVEKVCIVMPSAVRTECQEFVETYGKAIFELLARDVDPREMCKYLQLCPASGVLTGAPSNELTVYMDKKEECDMCQFALHELFGVLSDKDDEDEIRNVLDTLCYHLPATVGRTCEKFVDEYAEVVMQLIVKNLTPEKVCETISVCQRAEAVRALEVPAADTKCVFCEYVMETLESMLQNKTEEDEIRRALDELCDYMPGNLKKSCTQFVDKYSETLIDFLTHQLTPEQACQELGLCQSSVSSPIVEFSSVSPVVEDGKPYCMLCEYAINEVDKALADKQNEAEIRDALDHICYELSAPVKKECLAMVDRYAEDIIDMFVAEYTPNQVCAALGLCRPNNNNRPVNPVSNEIYVSPADQHDVADVYGGPLCPLCEFAMSVLEKQILTNRTMDMVEHAVEMLCSYLPDTVADQCTDFVDKYGDQIIHLIVVAEANPEEVCSLLALCDTAEENLFDASVVGGKKCIFGPAFWCQSVVHAKICGTTQHCIDNVWDQ